MLIDRIYRDEIDNHYLKNGLTEDFHYLSELIQITISQHPRYVSGWLQYFKNGYANGCYTRNTYKEGTDIPTMVEISKIRPGFSKINCEGEIIDIGTEREVRLKAGGTSRVADAILKDQTGTINLTLWDHNIKMVQKGSKVVITNAFAKDYKGKMSLSTGKFGKMDVVQY